MRNFLLFSKIGFVIPIGPTAREQNDDFTRGR
jgi:hypothetical protein